MFAIPADDVAFAQATPLYSESWNKPKVVERQGTSPTNWTIVSDKPMQGRAAERRLSSAIRTHTATVSELRGGGDVGPISFAIPIEVLSPLEEAREARAILLAKKYEKTASTEDSARLEIATRRVRRLDPRVTDQDRQTLGGLLNEIDEISAGLEDLSLVYAWLAACCFGRQNSLDGSETQQ